MKKLTIFFFFILITIYGKAFAQTDRVYYKDIYLSKKCDASKANYVSFTSITATGKMAHEIKQIKGNLTIQKELETGEPIGIWHYRKNRILDFDFSLNYIDITCTGTMLAIEKPFENNNTINYQAPLPDTHYKSILDFLSKNIIYPVHAIENGISGKAIVHFVITSAGEIQDITVTGSGDVSLDKEAVRVYRSLKLSSPPMINGKAVSICTSMPVTFKIDN